ncbi:ABC transporter substrate-binding protein [Streptomonospora salina]|uniref:Xylobiose transport system substrate-binding protein n=1 Tax=Streptomonospora salina TaxID=104205 RepID=A0A841ED44_9ACTN|nr:extracellular solute-binding protein [Streptomonospora salina]MBB6001052.1 xylobiose transport system substrate-binding protein [Streptomonospora salina]
MIPHRAGAAGAFALLLFATTACGGGSGDSGGSGGDGELNVMMYQDSLAVVQKNAAERFNENHEDVEAVVNEVPGDGYEDKLRTVMGSGQSPDMFFNWGGGSIEAYVDQEMLLPLGATLQENPEMEEAFIPSILEAGKVNDTQYGIPLRGTQPVMLFFNEQVFEDAGAEPPETWQDLLDLVDTFKDEGVTPFALGGATPWTEQMWMQYLVDRQGGYEVFQRIQNGDSEGWRDPAVLEAAETVQDLVDRGAFGDNYASVSYEEGGASALLSEGKAAMHLMGSWEYSTQLADAEEFAKEDLGYAAFPAMPDGDGAPQAVVGNPTNFFSVTDDGDSEAEVDFLKQTYTDEYVQDMVENGEVPTTDNSEEMIEEHSPNPDFATFQYRMVRDAPTFQLSWDQALDRSVAEPMVTEIERLFNKQVTPEEFVDNVAALQ